MESGIEVKERGKRKGVGGTDEWRSVVCWRCYVVFASQVL